MAKLIGNNPNQVPTNADLGDLAYVDMDNIPSVNVDGGTLVVDAATGRVGIGTNNPAALLEVNGGASSGVVRVSATGYTGLELQKFVANADALINLRDNGNMRFQTNNAERIRITSTGSVGIGTTSPAHKLDVAGEMIATSYNETFVAVTSATNATTVNCEAGNTFSHTLTENTTFTFSNPPATGTGYTMTIEIVQDAGASGYTVTWPTSVDFPAATAPTLTATASAVDVFVFTTRDGGANWYGFTAGLGLATPA